MRTYTTTVHCDVCGCEGQGSLRTAAAAWDSNRTIRHRDPSVCAENLQRQKRELDKREKELKQQLEQLNK